MRTGRCRRCPAMMHWAKSAATGKWMPLVLDTERGNVLVTWHDRALVFATHAEALSELDRDGDQYRVDTYLSHHANCPGRPENVERQAAADAQQQLC